MADEQVQDTKDQVLDTPPPDSPDDKGSDDGNGKDKLSADEYQAMLDRANKDRSAANKGEIAAKKRAEALEAKVKKYEDEKKTEAEKLEARAKEAEEEAATAKAETLTLRNRGHAQDAGVLKEYRAFAVSEFAKAEEEDPAEFFKTFKETHPAMFNGKAPADSTAKGGPNALGTPKKYDKEIAEHEEALKTERDPHQIKALKRSLRFMKTEQAKGA